MDSATVILMTEALRRVILNPDTPELHVQVNNQFSWYFKWEGTTLCVGINSIFNLRPNGEVIIVKSALTEEQEGRGFVAATNNSNMIAARISSISSKLPLKFDWIA